MRKIALLLGVGCLLVFSVASFASTVTFDDLPDPGAFGQPVPNGYAGLTWSNFFYLNAPDALSFDGPNGYYNNMVSATNVAYNGFGTPSAFSDNTFTLTSGYFGAAWNNGLMITVVGKFNGVVEDTTTFTANAAGPPVLVNFNWSGINEVDFSSSGGVPAGYNGSGTQFVLDNLVINGSNNVPEPASLFMLGTGLVGIAGLLRKRMKRV